MTTNPAKANRWDLGSSLTARTQRATGLTPTAPTFTTAMGQQSAADLAAYQRSKNRWNTFGKIATLAGAAPFAAYALPALVGGGGAAAAGTGAAASTGAAAGAGGLMASPWWKIGEMAVGTFGNLYGAHKQSQANTQALMAQERANAQALAFEREQEAERRRQFELQMAAAKQQWDAQQKFDADRWAASEDERLYDRRLREEREARLAPRRALAAQALQNLPDILARGRMSPGLQTLGSYRRT